MLARSLRIDIAGSFDRRPQVVMTGDLEPNAGKVNIVSASGFSEGILGENARINHAR